MRSAVPRAGDEIGLRADPLNVRRDRLPRGVDDKRRLVEETIGGSGGKRRTRGTYLLEALPGDAGTRISFELEMVEMPAGERLMGPLNRAYIKRINRRAMRRLKERLTTLD